LIQISHLLILLLGTGLARSHHLLKHGTMLFEALVMLLQLLLMLLQLLVLGAARDLCDGAWGGREKIDRCRVV
jgi:hypothetical protein